MRLSTWRSRLSSCGRGELRPSQPLLLRTRYSGGDRAEPDAAARIALSPLLRRRASFDEGAAPAAAPAAAGGLNCAGSECAVSTLTLRLRPEGLLGRAALPRMAMGRELADSDIVCGGVRGPEPESGGG